MLPNANKRLGHRRTEHYRLLRKAQQISYQNIKKILIWGYTQEVEGILFYLIQKPNIRVTVACEQVDAEQELNLDGIYQIKWNMINFSFDNQEEINALVNNHDTVISLVAGESHSRIAHSCITWNKHLVTPNKPSVAIK